jgi:hypothetical protein
LGGFYIGGWVGLAIVGCGYILLGLTAFSLTYLVAGRYFEEWLTGSYSLVTVESKFRNDAKGFRGLMLLVRDGPIRVLNRMRWTAITESSAKGRLWGSRHLEGTLRALYVCRTGSGSA